jgi:hypothetical protein
MDAAAQPEDALECWLNVLRLFARLRNEIYIYIYVPNANFDRKWMKMGSSMVGATKATEFAWVRVMVETRGMVDSRD